MLRNIFRYEKDKYMHSGKLILPEILMCGYLGFAYSIAPQNILDSFSLCSLVVFLLMLSVGVMYDDINYQMIEMSMFVKLKKKELLYFGKVMMIAYISLTFTLASILIPILLHCLNKMQLFDRAIVFSDILSGSILFFLVSMSGGITGLLANRRIFSNRTLAISLSALTGIAAITKVSLNKDIFITRFFTWILPPVNEISIAYCKETYFSLNSTGIYFIWLLLYIVIEIFIYIKLMLRRGYA